LIVFLIFLEGKEDFIKGRIVMRCDSDSDSDSEVMFR
jgi:hypothetical protein